jgi:hypothetical protein
MEIERRYDRSHANKIFKMPKLENFSDDERGNSIGGSNSVGSDSSLESLRNVTTYNL